MMEVDVKLVFRNLLVILVAVSKNVIRVALPFVRSAWQNLRSRSLTKYFAWRPVVAVLLVGGLGGVSLVNKDRVITLVHSVLAPKRTQTALIHPAVPFTHPGTFVSHDGSVTGVSWAPDGKHIAAGYSNGPVRVWDTTTSHKIYTYWGNYEYVYAVAWSPNGKYLASADNSGRVLVWEAATGHESYIYHGHTSPVDALAWSPDSQRIVSGDTIGNLEVWDATSGDHVSVYRSIQLKVLSVAWSPDGSRIAAVGFTQYRPGVYAQGVQVWDTSSEETIFTFNEQSKPVGPVIWSPDSKHIAFSNLDRTLQVWDVETSGNSAIFREPPYRIPGLAWSPNGKYLALGSADGRVEIRDPITGSIISTFTIPSLPHHSPTRTRNTINAVAWSPNSKFIASGSADGALRVWQLK